MHFQHDVEKLDPRGRTPLMLAVRLCHLQSVKVLLAAKCNANAEREGWSVVQEAVCTGDAAILTAILEVRDLQRHIQRTTHVPQLLQKLIDAPDFYVEMKWEFTSWGKWIHESYWPKWKEEKIFKCFVSFYFKQFHWFHGCVRAMCTKCISAVQMFASTQLYWDSIIRPGSVAIVLMFSKEMVRIDCEIYLKFICNVLNSFCVSRCSRFCVDDRN